MKNGPLFDLHCYMKNRLLLLLLWLLPVTLLQAQLSTAEKDKLTTALLKRINDHRKETGHLLLERNSDLNKAAVLHCNYLSKLGDLSHDQPNPDLKNPKKRVDKFNKSFVAVGENVLYSKPTDLPLDQVEINKLAFDMFRSWKNSPGHYANMISDVFDHSDLAFDYDTKTKRVYAVHVFGKLGYSVPNQLSDNAFGILKTDDYCNHLLGGKQNILTNMGNSISIEGDEVIFRFHDKDFIGEALEDPKDGVAVDLVAREQMKCGEANRLDASEIYDGVLLKPIYRDEFFSKNTAESEHRIIVSLGKVPPHLVGKELSPNMVFLKWGMKCNYVTPTTVPSGYYPLKRIDPVPFVPNVKLKTEGIKNVTELLFEFKTGESEATNSPLLPEGTGDLFALDIKSHTSVDGNATNNHDLHLKRADFIKNHIGSKVDLSKTKITIDAKENWELLDYQLERLGLEDIRKLPKTKIREFVNREANGRLLYSLKEQRRSTAVLYEKGSWSISDEKHLYYNLVNGLILNDMDLANKALVEMYRDSTKTFFLEESFIMDRLFNKSELVQNVSALMLKDINKYTLDNVVFFVRTWLNKSGELSIDAQKNLLNLYTITSRRMLLNWDLSAFNLRKIMHPEKVEPLFESYKADDQVDPLFLNFHMTRIRYYGQINEYDKTGESFDFITDYFRNQALTIKDDIALCLFFNSWSMYHLTNELLFKRFVDDRLNEESAFILAQTAMAYPYSENSERLSQAVILELYKKALSFNRLRWCSWLDLDFQNLRDDALKNLYCNECNK